ncbi:VWA domain-containing protein [Desertihabitans aurantiacus]|uniref:VWA domain-containing protein n=1 Tax=Desertihabitans aurantiacus TaxID=2282477 RepID=UPI001E39C55B|nr:VWA domain-containing protein [Desertihabitans aurantiacus]
MSDWIFPPAGFEVPSRLWLLLLIPLIVAVYVVVSRLRNRRGMRYTNTSMLESVVPRQSQWRRHLAVALSLLSLVTLTMAFARPVAQADEPLPRSTIVVVVDVSLSMEATDVEPSRIEAAKTAAKEFIVSLPAEYNVSVVSLSGSPAIVIPPTTDHAAASRAVDTLQLQESTAIGEAMITGLRALEQAPRDPDDPDAIAPGAIVLLSDGESTVGRPPQQAAAEVAEAQVRTFTIAYGTENGYVDLEGVREPVPPDVETMRQIAERTGGTAYEAESADDLSEVYADVAVESGTRKVDQQVTAQYAGFGLVFAVLAALGAISLGVRWP